MTLIQAQISLATTPEVPVTKAKTKRITSNHIDFTQQGRKQRSEKTTYRMGKYICKPYI